MDSSIDVERATGGSVASGAERDLLSVEPRRIDAHHVRSWWARHSVSLRWFLPVLLLGTGVHAVILAFRAGTAEFSGAAGAVALASLSAVLLWVLARRLLFGQPAAALAVFLFLLSPLALASHTSSSLENFAVPLLLAGTIVVAAPRRARRLRMLVAAFVAAILVVVLLVDLVLPAAPLPSSTVGGWWATDPAILLLGSGCSVAALAIVRLRPFAVVSLGLVLVAFRPGGDLPVSAVALWLPLATLLVAGSVQAAARAAWDAGFTEVWLEIVSGVFLVAVVGVLIFAAPSLAPGYRALFPGAPDRAAGAADPAGGASAGTAAESAAGSAAGNTAGSAAGSAAGDTTGNAAGNTADAGADAVAAAQALADARTSARASDGLQLSANPQLELAPQAEAELVAGDVDVRSILALGQLLASTSVRVSDFPAVEGEDGLPRRQILLSSIGGQPSSAGSAAGESVSGYFLNLAAPLGGANVVTTDDGMLVIFPFGEPVALLPAAQGP
ncbi:MAG: hypothetical protein JWR01_2605 [Subtercola sp.]|nr:hypothetical protein [Subtercola sp.]